MLFYLTGMRVTAAVLVWAVLAGCGRDARLSSMDGDDEPAAARKASSAPASVISVLGVRG